MVGRGKKKIKITRIIDKNKRRVTFSKRRKGASELDISFDAAIISVSEAGTIFTAGRSSFIHGLLLGGGGADVPVGGGRAGGGGGGVEYFDGGRLDCMEWEELATELAAVKKVQRKIELLMLERNNNNAAVFDFAGDPIAAFSSAFVDPAAAAPPPPPPPEMPAFTSPSSSKLERETCGRGCSRGVGMNDNGFLVVQ